MRTKRTQSFFPPSDQTLLENLRPHLRGGCCILSGGNDAVSWIIQRITGSDYSHAVIYLGFIDGIEYVVESMDFALTPFENDEGVVLTPLDLYLERLADTTQIMVLDPIGIDRGRLMTAVLYLSDHAPTFPSCGIAWLGLCHLVNGIFRRFGHAASPRLTAFLVRCAGDGTAKMHCAETVVRLYWLAGLRLEFVEPRLLPQMRHAQLLHGDSMGFGGLPTEERRAATGGWPMPWLPSGLRIPFNIPYAIASGCAVFAWRGRRQEATDAADYSMPGDLEQAEPFNRWSFKQTTSGWKETS